MPQIGAPKDGVKIRMYRQGHGDCFLLTMRKDDGSPFYILIDCGIWTNSEIKVPVEDIIDDIVAATGGHLHVLVITHEHMDHVNMFTAKLNGKKLFDRITVDTLWFGWTANRKDKTANKIREAHDQAVKRLAAYVNKLRLRKGLGVADLVSRLDDLLGFEGIEPPKGFAASSSYVQTVFSQATMLSKTAPAMDYVFDKVPNDTRRIYFKPHDPARAIPGVSNIRVFALGPPRSTDRLDQEEPEGEFADRLYKKTESHGIGLDFGFASALEGILGAAATELADDPDAYRPFAKKFERTHSSGTPDERAFFRHFLPSRGKDQNWRKIDRDWLFALDWFARKINVHINNSSLVIAILLEQSGKVLLFAADAQYGNWITWADKPLRLDEEEISVHDLLARTVFYKVGHHGSHNATLKGTPQSEYANLDWLGQGKFAEEFVAVIPANEAWAYKKQKWPHPLKAIRTALTEKAGGRVFQSSVDFAQMKKTPGSSLKTWNRFIKRSQGSAGQDLYFDYWIPDS